MKTVVVFCAFAVVACYSLVTSDHIHHSVMVLDSQGHPIKITEVINGSTLNHLAKFLPGNIHVVPTGYVPAALSVVQAIPANIDASALNHVDTASFPEDSTLGHEHLLKKRSLGHLFYSAPVIAPSAVSHQARVDVISSPAVVSYAVAPVVNHTVHSPVAVAPAAVSYQSRVDVRSPTVIAYSVAVPVVSNVVDAPVAHNIWDATVYEIHSHGHYLKKRSLAAYVTPYVHAAPAAVSHQSRVDVVSTPAVVAHAAPVAVEQVVPTVVAVPAAVPHQARVDVISSDAHVAPLAHHDVLTVPAHWGYSRLFNGHW